MKSAMAYCSSCQKYGEPRNSFKSPGTNLPVARKPSIHLAMRSAGCATGQSGITGAASSPHVPQKTNAASAAKNAAKATNAHVDGLRRIYLTDPSAMSANTIAKMATVSTMPRAAR